MLGWNKENMNSIDYKSWRHNMKVLWIRAGDVAVEEPLLTVIYKSLRLTLAPQNNSINSLIQFCSLKNYEVYSLLTTTQVQTGTLKVIQSSHVASPSEPLFPLRTTLIWAFMITHLLFTKFYHISIPNIIKLLHLCILD